MSRLTFLRDFEDNSSAASAGVELGVVFYYCFGKLRFPVHRLQFPGVIEKFPFIEPFADPGSQSMEQIPGAEVFDAVEFNTAKHCPAAGK